MPSKARDSGPWVLLQLGEPKQDARSRFFLQLTPAQSLLIINLNPGLTLGAVLDSFFTILSPITYQDPRSIPPKDVSSPNLCPVSLRLSRLGSQILPSALLPVQVAIHVGQTDLSKMQAFPL